MYYDKALWGLLVAIPNRAQGWLLRLRAAACISLHSGRSVRAVGHCELRAGSESRAPVRGTSICWTFMLSSLAGTSVVVRLLVVGSPCLCFCCTGRTLRMDRELDV